MRVFENMVLRKIYGPKSDEVTEYYSGNRIKKNEMGGAFCTYDRRGTYRVLVGKPERKKTLGIRRHRRKDDIKMDLQEIR
jgi:hypothetical protein